MESNLLERLLQHGESQTVEFKIAAPRQHDLASRLCGMANAAGGYLVLGVEDKIWSVVGLKNPNQAVDDLLAAARICKPPVQFDPPNPEVVVVQGQPLVVATIPANAGRLHQTGGAFWVRRGTHTIPLELEDIESRLYNRGSLQWETKPVQNATLADLDMLQVRNYLENRPERRLGAGRLNNVEQVLVNLGLAVAGSGQDELHPTNAGMLLFGHTPQQFLWQAELICTLYAQGDGLGLRRYADRRIIHGTLSQQIDQAEAFFKQYMPVAATVEGFHRVNLPDFPLEALREAVVNALVHRDYSLDGERVRVLFFTGDKVEVHSPGLLLPGIDLEALRQGRVRSKSRNRIIAGVLRDLPAGYMEQAGSGIGFMLNQMRDLGRPLPDFEERDEFIVTFYRHLPNLEIETFPETPQSGTAANNLENLEIDPENELAAAPPAFDLSQPERQELALQHIKRYGYITNKRYRELSGISKATAYRDLEVLVKQGILKETGEKRARRYIIL